MFDEINMNFYFNRCLPCRKLEDDALLLLSERVVLVDVRSISRDTVEKMIILLMFGDVFHHSKWLVYSLFDSI